MDGNVKLRFIKEVLASEGNRFFRNQGFAMNKELELDSKEILSRRKKTITNVGDASATLQMTFTAYTRFLDIKNDKGGKIKSFRIYNRFVMGHYYAIAYRLQHDFTEEVKLSIRNRFNSSR